MAKNDQEKIMAEVLKEMGNYILEGGEFPKLSGDEDQVRAIKRATLASRRFYEALCNERSTLDTVATMMDEKSRASDEFKRVMGRDWVL
jgi:ABC-type cobalamin/Fe3+-siderophores transport system ATPase subunit